MRSQLLTGRRDSLNTATPVENTVSVAFSSGTKQHATSKPDTVLGTGFCFFSTCFRAPVQITVHFPDCLLYVLDWDACLGFFDLILFIDQTQHVFFFNRYILIVEAQNNVFKKKTEIEFSRPQSECHMGR